MTRKLSIIIAAVLLALRPSVAHAHPAEQALVLLLPTELYNLGGTLAVAISILLIGLVPRGILARLFGSVKLGPAPKLEGAEQVTQITALAALLLVILIGFTGPNDPQNNLLPLMFWTGFWVMVFLIQGLVFDIWRWINPWAGLAKLAAGEALWKMPKHWTHWPAVTVFLAFQYFMLADIAPNDPDRLGWILLGYTVFTWAAMQLFGGQVWLERGECFSVLFRLIGSLKAFQRMDGLRVGIPGWAAARLAPLDTSLSVFCLMILISGSFDGLRESFWWLGLLGINPLEFPGRSAVVWPSTLGLVGANLLVIAVYAATIWVGVALVRRHGEQISFATAFNTLSIAFLPIALGYHFAHYFVSLLVQSQYLALVLGDPIARGWNLFGLAETRVTTGFLNSMETVRPILLTNVFAVVGSHLASVILSHRLAETCVTGRKRLVLLQLALGILMVCYTLFGLWLLSTPRGA